VKVNKNLKTALIWASPALVALLFYFLMLPIELVVGVPVILYFVMLVMTFLPNKIKHKDDMQRAWEYLCDWWYKFRKEDISSINAKAFERFFGDDKFIAFVITRGEVGKAHMPLVAVVKTNSLEVVDWNDNPDDDKIKNPFKDISPYFTGTPSPSIKPELEPILRGRLVKKKEKKEKEEEKEEEEGEEELGLA
jgi:hypothetical protein